MRRAMSRLSADTRGVTAVIFAVCATILFGAIGLALDYARFLKTRVEVQVALDAAVLAASSARLTSDEDRQQVFTSTLQANLKDKSAAISPTFVYSPEAGGRGVATFTQATSFMAALGVKTARASLTATANEVGVDIEVALVIDISGSMMAPMSGSGSRLDAMKAAADQMITALRASKPPGSSLKFSLVPFNMAVNIGTNMSTYVSGTSNPLFNGTTWGGCVLERRNGYHHRSIYRATASDGSGKWPAYIWPPAPNNGYCLNPSNGTNTSYARVEPAPLGTNPWVEGPNFNCPRYPIVPLTDDDAAIRRAIGDLISYGNMGTTIGPAVGWALRVLSPDEPFDQAAAFSARTRKIMVVLSDGAMVTDGSSCAGATNSTQAYQFDPQSLGLQGRALTSAPVNDSFTPYGFLFDSNPYNVTMSTALDADRELDRLSLEACAEAKQQANLQIFTIGVSNDTANARAQAVLVGCATSPAHSFVANDATAMEAAFLKIAEKAAALRITN